jgi:hypothetical protein
MLLAAPRNASFRPVALTVAALAVAGGTAFTAHAVFADTPTRGHTPATVTPGITAPGYDSGVRRTEPRRARSRSTAGGTSRPARRRPPVPRAGIPGAPVLSWAYRRS